MEPEHSKQFPLLKIEYLFPRIFGNDSILLSDPLISQVYFNGLTDVEQVQSIIA